MGRRYKEGLLPFKIVPCEEPLVALPDSQAGRSGLLLPYEMAKALKLLRAVDKELPLPRLLPRGQAG